MMADQKRKVEELQHLVEQLDRRNKELESQLSSATLGATHPPSYNHSNVVPRSRTPPLIQDVVWAPPDDDLAASTLFSDESDVDDGALLSDVWLYRSPKASRTPLTAREWLGGELANDELADVMQKLVFTMKEEGLDELAAESPLNRSWQSLPPLQRSWQSNASTPDAQLNHSFDLRELSLVARADVQSTASSMPSMPSPEPSRRQGETSDDEREDQWSTAGEEGYVHVPNPLRVRRKHEHETVPKRKVQLPLSKARRKSSASRETLLAAAPNTFMV